MTINIRNDADLEVSIPHVFRNINGFFRRYTNGGYNYIDVGAAGPHLFKTYSSSPPSDIVSVTTGDERFDITEDNSINIEIVSDNIFRYQNDIPFRDASGNVTLALSYIVNGRERNDDLVKTGVSVSSTSRVINNINANNLITGMIITGSGIPSNTTIESIDPVANTITITNRPTVTDSSMTVKFPLVTLRITSSSHRFIKNDMITVSGVGAGGGWDGVFKVIDPSPDGLTNRVRFTYDFINAGYNPAVFTTDFAGSGTGTVSLTITNVVTKKAMINNQAELTLSGDFRYQNNDTVPVVVNDGGSTIGIRNTGSWFTGNRNITVDTNAKKIYFSTATSDLYNFLIMSNVKGWTRAKAVYLNKDGIDYPVYPELPLTSVSLTPPSVLSVGTQLSITSSYTSVWRYRTESFSYIWISSPDNSISMDSWTQIGNGPTYTLQTGDQDKYIAFKMLATNTIGTSTAYSNSILFLGPLKAPTGLSIMSTTTTSAVIYWNSVANASSYEYAFGTSPNPTTFVSSGITAEASGFKASLTGLVSNTKYYFRVRAKRNSTDISGNISSIDFNTNLATPTASAIVYLSTNEYSGSASYSAARVTAEVQKFGRVQLSTTIPAGGRAIIPNKYRIQYQLDGSTTWVDLPTTDSATSLAHDYQDSSSASSTNLTTIDYLIPKNTAYGSLGLGKSYRFRVAACDSSSNLLTGWSTSSSLVAPFGPPELLTNPNLITSVTPSAVADGVVTGGIRYLLTIEWNVNRVSTTRSIDLWAVSRKDTININDVTDWVHADPPSITSYRHGDGPSQASWLNGNTTYSLSLKPIVGYTSTKIGDITYSNLDVANAFSSSYDTIPGTTSTTPGQPTALAAAPNKSGSYPNGIPTINVSWTAPTDTGRDPIESYLYRIGTANPPTGATWRSTGNSNTTLTISTNSAGSNLQLNTLYYIQIRSTNTVGSSSEATAPVVSARTWNVPSPPSTLSYSDATATGVTISWTTPSNNGGTPIIGYGLQRNQSPNEGSSYSAPPDASVPPWKPGWESSLSGTWFWFRVKSYNDLGISTSFAVINPPTVPSQPSAPTNVRTNSTTNTVSWTAPSSNGGGTMTYDVYRSQNASTWTFQKNVSTTSTTVAATAGTTYFFAIKAKNSIGSSLQSPASIRV